MEGYCNSLCLHFEEGQHPNLQLTLMGPLLLPAERWELATLAGLEDSQTASMEDILESLHRSMWNSHPGFCTMDQLKVWARVGNLDKLRPLLPRVRHSIPAAFVEAARTGQVHVLAALYPLRNLDRLSTYHRALFLAAETGQVVTIAFFESKYPDLLTDSLRLALAKQACAGPHLKRELLEYLLPDQEGQDHSGKLLESALTSGSEELSAYLLERLNPHTTFLCINRCFVLSAEKGYLAVMEELQARGASNLSGALAAACGAGQVHIVRALLTAWTPRPALLSECLYEAIRKGAQIELLRLLVEPQAPNFNLGLEAAAESGNLAATTLMLELGATQLEDPFYWAARHGHYELVVLLRQAGASNLQQALEGAAYGGYPRVVKYLLGQEPGLPCEEALSEALDRKSKQNPKVIRYLLRRRPSNVRQIALSLARNFIKPAVREILDEYIKNEPGEAASSV